MASKDILVILTKDLESKVKSSIYRRVEAMRSNLSYFQETDKPELIYIISRGVTPEKIDTVFCLASFYQIVLGPLASSAYINNRQGLGSKVPIQYGQLSFNTERSNSIKETHMTFKALVEKLGIPFYWLYYNRVDDLIFYIAKKFKEGEFNE